MAMTSRSSTNYALVRITNTATNHVFFARTTNPSSSLFKGYHDRIDSTSPCRRISETGPSTLDVATNGIHSPDVSINRALAGTKQLLTTQSTRPVCTDGRGEWIFLPPPARTVDVQPAIS